MPPRTRGSTKTKKDAKENIGGVSKFKVKSVTKVTNQRKPLADKTNSASDDNSSPLVNKGAKTDVITKHVDKNLQQVRLRRERVLPSRYKENNVLIKIIQDDPQTPPTNIRRSVKDSSILSPVKTSHKESDKCLVVNRPKRVCRLPSRFNEHSVSPNKVIPVGCIASTPILQKKCNQNPKTQSSDLLCNISPVQKKCVIEKNTKRKLVPKTIISADTNNNAKDNSVKTQKSQNSPLTGAVKRSSHVQPVQKKILPSHLILPVVEEEKKLIKRDNSHLDVYEFTYDPNEEPPPKKKKPKRNVKKRPPKPKMFIIKDNYNKNVSRALAALSSTLVKKKPLESQKALRNKDNHINNQQNLPTITEPSGLQTSNQIVSTCIQAASKSTNIVPKHVEPIVQTNKNILSTVEEIAADFDCPIDHDIDYSPVASPNHAKESYLLNHEDNLATLNHDPLNLQENVSFFDEPPVASSSMNISVRKPYDSPWRVEFDQLPIKWHVNTYVKPNMTPAVESSFINFDDNKNKKKHVYTDMVPESNCEIPEICDSDQRNLKQTSIISFIRERLENSANKRKRAKSVTPTKANSIFEDVSGMSLALNSDKTPQKTPMKESNLIANKSSKGKVTKNVTEPVKSAAKDKDGTYFGFDDSEDQENVSPIKITNPRVQALRPRGRAVLQEINAQSGPSRVNIPHAPKIKITAHSDTMKKVYEELKTATNAPVSPEIHVTEDPVDPGNIETQHEQDINDSQSVHLFEDIEVVHHQKPTRKSYGKGKKVTFRNQTTLDAPFSKKNTSDSLSGDEDDLADLTFNFKDEKQKPKRKVKKKQLSRKEKAEMDAWAAQFNSMCEDVEDFPLVVE